ncbi:endonuclease [Mycobacteroides saopaulense]|uniref:endonuclease n=1 Tax=Mycobacteroides saopaulense TaxID=1578165 RepID=UPI000720EF9D|nr:endonuclease [Mycobacteroides saopaulense]ALR10824.1 endonuclease [Mycobacteroides saopaulense]
MSLSVGELKKVSVQSIRDIAAGLRAKAASMRATKTGVSDLPHKGTWTGVAADNADHEIGTFGKGLGTDAEAYENAATKVDRAGDEFEGLRQLLTKLENEAAGKFSINEATGEVTPLSKDFNKSDRDYIANTIKQLCAAGGQANDDLAAGIHAADASGTTTPAGATGALPAVPGSAIKPDGSMGALQNLAAPSPDGDPGTTKAAAAGTDTQANYKEWYPKTTVPGSDKPIDPRLLGGLEAAPGVRDGRDQIPQRTSPTLQPRDVPAFKETTRALLQKQGVPADQIEAKVNAAVERAQTPHFLPDAPSATPSEHVSRDFGEQFNKFTNGISDSASRTVDGQIDQAKVLTGQAGPGAPGVAEAWKELAVDTGKGLINQAHELMTDPLAAPKMGIEEARDFVNSPSEYIGKNIIHGTEALAGGAVGGEAAAGARGLLGDLTGAEGHAITHGIDSPHPAPTVEHTPAGSVDHPSPGVGLDHPTPNPGSWNHSIEHYSPQAPQLAADLNNAFTNGHPTAELAGQVADHSTHHAPGIGSTANPDRVVLGKWDGQDGGYIGEARHNGGIYFDTGDDTWNAVGRGLDDASSRSLGWQVNEQFLRTQLENRVPRVDYVLPEGFTSVEQVAAVQRRSFSAMEINFLKENAAAYGYVQQGNVWVYTGGK